MIEDHFAARKLVPRDGEVPYRPLVPEQLYLDRPGWDAMLGNGPLFGFSPFAKPEGAVGVDCFDFDAVGLLEIVEEEIGEIGSVSSADDCEECDLKRPDSRSRFSRRISVRISAACW